MRILAIETSADETAAAVVEDGTKIISNVIASSAKMHRKYGGIVPEIAARRQLEFILPVITEALLPLQSGSDIKEPKGLTPFLTIMNTNIDAIAVTVGPGLIGSLLVGVETAKTIAFVTGKPIIPVNHVIAHMYANFVNSPLPLNPSSPPLKVRGGRVGLPSGGEGELHPQEMKFPAISLVVSGGHTELYLMKSIKELQWLGGTLDDAAGECFDKTARLLGFENGGVSIQAAAEKCHPGLVYPESSRRDPGSILRTLDSGSEAGMTKKQIKLPRPMMNDESFNFSFSGLKTAVLREWKKCPENQVADDVIPAKAGIHAQKKTGSRIKSGMTKKSFLDAFAYEIQEAITDVLVEKTLRAAKQYEAKSILLSGGVAANTRLREKFSVYRLPFTFVAPEVQLCTDNAVAIASYAFFRGEPTDWHKVTTVPDLSVEAYYTISPFYETEGTFSL